MSMEVHNRVTGIIGNENLKSEATWAFQRLRKCS